LTINGSTWSWSAGCGQQKTLGRQSNQGTFWAASVNSTDQTILGRPLSLDPSQRRRIAERYAAGETMAALAREYSCGEATIWRALQ